MKRQFTSLWLAATLSSSSLAFAQTGPKPSPAEPAPSAATAPTATAPTVAAPTATAPATTTQAVAPDTATDAEPGAVHSEPAATNSASAATTADPESAEAQGASKTPKDAAALMAELDAELGADVSGVGSTPNLSLYGFTDIGFYKYFIHKGSPFRTILFPRSAFAVGNLNLYLAGELGDNWRSLAEVRFTYLPNGSRTTDASGVHRTTTTVSDYTNLGRVRQTGSILIERAWLEYTANSMLTVRGGSWLTPYGVWNEDHGSPTIIPVSRPYAIGLELLPERQTGVLAYGNYYASETLTLGYALGVSNGRGPVSDFADLDENKAVTLRLNGTLRGTGVFSFGASAYVGRYTDLREEIVLEGTTAKIEDVITQQYDEASFGLDARYTLGGFHAQTELLVNDQVFIGDGRPVRLGNEFQPDNRRYGAYAVLGYRFDWFGLMPYVTAEYFSLINVLEPTRAATTDILTDFALGLNARPSTNVTLKLEGNLGVFNVENSEGSAFEHPVPAVQAQAAWAF